jgi:hypothetical protein
MCLVTAIFYFFGHFNRYIGAVIWGSNKPHAVTTSTTDSRSKSLLFFPYIVGTFLFLPKTLTGIQYPDTLEKLPMQIFQGQRLNATLFRTPERLLTFIL